MLFSLYRDTHTQNLQNPQNYTNVVAVLSKKSNKSLLAHMHIHPCTHTCSEEISAEAVSRARVFGASNPEKSSFPWLERAGPLTQLGKKFQQKCFWKSKKKKNPLVKKRPQHLKTPAPRQATFWPLPANMRAGGELKCQRWLPG